jgi:lysosomal acid phosphatase
MPTRNKTTSALSLIILLFVSTAAYTKQTLVFAIDIIRHGDRTPTIEIPKDPYHWPEGLGELTAIGMHQEFDLGNNFRKEYINQYQLLPKKYAASTLYARSTDFNRTLMSGESLLFGLYPLGTGPALRGQTSAALPMYYQPIPIHTVPQPQDSLLRPENKEDFKQLIAQYVIASDAWQTKLSQSKTKLQRWSKITGIPMKDLYQVIPLSDNLYIRKLYSVPMPRGISNQDRDEIINLGQWAIRTIYQPYKVGDYASKNLRATIANYLLKASQANSKLKYVLFSAHDITLLALMSAFHHPLNGSPPYASDMKILLFKNDVNGEYYVKLTFNGKNIRLAGCQHALCTIEEFLTGIN